MPIIALWSLVISLAVFAFAVAVRSATTSHQLKMVDKEIDSLIAQITSLKQEHEKAISSLSQLHQAEVRKVLISYEKSMNKLLEQTIHYQYPRGGLADLIQTNKRTTLADLPRKINP
jgi:septal ring factor EnvC (AmiA/AmiB activator)